MNQITLSLGDNPELAEMLSAKKPGERVKLTDVVVLISEKDDKTFSGVVEEVSGDEMYESDTPADESLPSVKVAKKKKGQEKTGSTQDSQSTVAAKPAAY